MDNGATPMLHPGFALTHPPYRPALDRRRLIHDLLGTPPQFVRICDPAVQRDDLVHRPLPGQQHLRIEYDGVDAIQAAQELRIEGDRST
ncbi:MAG TPA: hypothetical protein VGJ44_00930, partial [Kribbellaceae bacterium]